MQRITYNVAFPSGLQNKNAALRCMRVDSNDHWNEDVIMCLISWNAIKSENALHMNLAWNALQLIVFLNHKSG